QPGLVFTNALPAGTSLVSMNASSTTTSCGVPTANQCTLNSGIASNGTETITIVAHVPATAIGTNANQLLSDTASISTTLEDPDTTSGSNTKIASITANAAADVQISQAVIPAAVPPATTPATLAGNATAYTITV